MCLFSPLSTAWGRSRGSEITSKNRHIFVSETWKPVQWWHWAFFGGRSKMRHCACAQFYRNTWLAFLQDVLHVQCGSSSGPPLSKRTERNSVNVSDQASPVYYLPWFRMARSGSGSAAITSSREGPRDSDLPAATAARSSLLSAPITGASVPTWTNSVVQPSEQPLPLPEVLPSSPADTFQPNIRVLSLGMSVSISIHTAVGSRRLGPDWTRVHLKHRRQVKALTGVPKVDVIPVVGVL